MTSATPKRTATARGTVVRMTLSRGWCWMRQRPGACRHYQDSHSLSLGNVANASAGAGSPGRQRDPAGCDDSVFDEILAKLRDLAQHCLMLLHVEMRCHVHYFIDLAVREVRRQRLG